MKHSEQNRAHHLKGHFKDDLKTGDRLFEAFCLTCFSVSQVVVCLRPLFVCAKKADAFRFNILAGFFHSNQLEVWRYSVCSLQNIRALCTLLNK